MQPLKQMTAAFGLVVSLGLVMPSSLGGPVFADVSRDHGIQPMTISCEELGIVDHEVISIDHDPGDKMATLQDLDSSLVFVPQSGYVTSIFTAIENDADTSPEARVALEPSELPDGYPASFVTPPGYPFSYFGDGFSRGDKDKKKNLVDCTVIDVGNADDGETCLKDGVPQSVCFENTWEAEAHHVAESSPCVVNGVEQTACMANGVTYHYEDIFTIKAVMTGKNGKLKSNHQQKHKKARGHHRREGKHRH